MEAEITVIDETLTALAALRRRGRPSLNRVARMLDRSPRTLQRQLNLHRVSFLQLLQDYEMATAKQLLANEKLPITMIGASLGYRDPSSFSRAFRSWTGLTAREYRQSLKSPDNT